MLYQTVRPLIFALTKNDPEVSHEKAMHLLEWCDHHSPALNTLDALFKVRDARLFQYFMGLAFPHPVGLAAGFSKDGLGAKSLAKIFGSLELGTVTPPPQAGNPRPRMFRLKKDRGLINRMGFNNLGAPALAEKRRLQGQLEVPVGISIGKAKDTPLEKAGDDYETCLEAVYDYGDYFVINVSSPNTKDLRRLQDKDLFRQILRLVILKAKSLAAKRKSITKPILVKVAPDLSVAQVDDVLDVCCEFYASGIILVNTTVSRDGLKNDVHKPEIGGYSGPQLFGRALAMVKHVRAESVGLTIIAAGGISRDYHAKEMLESGADLLQLFTGLVYEGPFVVKHILDGLLRSMEIAGVKSIPGLRGEKPRLRKIM